MSPDAGPGPGLRDRLFALLLWVLPHHLLSRVVHAVTRWDRRPVKDWLIRTFIRVFAVDMSEAAASSPGAYPTFNDFFTRALRPGARPLAPDAAAVLCPADGVVSQIGAIEGGRILQAKGRWFTLADLLAGDQQAAALFAGGTFATVYLSPRDYHRVHMPLSGTLRSMAHVPGRLFSVMPATTRTVQRLFARNERIVNLFDTPAGPMGLVLVGAIFVASMDTVWAGPVTPVHRRISHWRYGEPEAPVALERGEEMGRFNMGSTVILLFPPGTVEWSPDVAPGMPVRMGQALGRMTVDRGGLPDGRQGRA
jgi:phosphatidylserine decarboxylase